MPPDQRPEPPAGLDTKAKIARHLSDLEAQPFDAGNLALLDWCWQHAGGHVLGLTGPPGVGKSTLTSKLIEGFRARDKSVATVAIDPSSTTTKGAVLGDRTRFAHDLDDPKIFIRSMAARDRLGGLAAITAPCVTLLTALFNQVIVETVGVGQSEIDVHHLADTTLLALQPASGDNVQMLKAGIIEIPDIIVMTKADLGQIARHSLRDVRHILRARPAEADGWQTPQHLISAMTGEGMDDLFASIEAHRNLLESGRAVRRRERKNRLIEDAMREHYGRAGLKLLDRHPGWLEPSFAVSPYSAFARIKQTVDPVLADLR